MDSFEFNKIAGAILGTALFVLLITFASGTIFSNHGPEEPAYLADLGGTAGEEHGSGPAEPADEPIAMLMASADAGAGETVFKKCKACHSVEKDGKNGTGPNLWNIVNRPMASVAGFSYSSALTGFAEGGKAWDYEALNAFLAKPKSYVSGTKMGFGGLSKSKDRANVILYLRTLSDAPAPLPAAGESASTEASDAGSAAQTASAESGMAETGTDAAPAVSTETASTADTSTADAGAAGAGAAGSSTENASAAGVSTENTSAAGASTENASAEVAKTETPAETAEAAKPAETTMAANTPSSEAGGAASGVLAMIGAQDPAAGEKVFRKCKACHTSDEAGKNKVGPALWNIVNRPVAAVDGFNYSDAMKGHAEGGKVWNYAELDGYLAAPKKYIPGNKMGFSGLRKDEDRAAILAYLRTLASDPAPLP